jgi:hypothetical protein
MNLDSFYGSGPELNAEKSIEMSGVKETLNSAIKKLQRRRVNEKKLEIMWSRPSFLRLKGGKINVR